MANSSNMVVWSMTALHYLEATMQKVQQNMAVSRQHLMGLRRVGLMDQKLV